jgi:ribosomal protein S18 acetylase RimI-like enzyme
MIKIDIQKATINDTEEVQNICIKTFYETFSTANSEENMQKYLSENFSINQLNIELNNENSEFYFATTNNTIIGYVKLNFGSSQTELKDKHTAEIERIYILKEFYGKKVGQVLCDKAIEIAKQKRVAFIWLGVWEENLRAINFYKKNGFIEFDKHIFSLGQEEQTDIMMKLKLNA